MNPPINQANSSDEDEQNNYESADENELVSPNRPHQSPSASPRALLRPDPPRVEEVLQEVEQQLRHLPSREQRAANRNAVRQAQAAAEAAAEAAATAQDRPLAAAEVAEENMDFETENGQDGAKASELGRQIKVEFSVSDIKFWFAELEAEMVMASIKSQFLKKTVLQRNLPTKQKEDVKALLTLTQTEAGEDIYFKIKTELIRIYAPKAKDSYCKALTRTMVGLPSQLGNQIVDDVCKKAVKLSGCCCASAVEALWQLQLPVGVRAHVSNMEFSKDTYKQVFEAADKVYLSSRQVSVAAMASSVAAVSVDNLDETQAAFTTQNQPQVAAFGKGASGSGRGGRNRNNKNKNQNSGSKPQGATDKDKDKTRGKKHSSNPPDSVCSRHYRYGPESWYCVAPTTCPWKDKVASRP